MTKLSFNDLKLTLVLFNNFGRRYKEEIKRDEDEGGKVFSEKQDS